MKASIYCKCVDLSCLDELLLDIANTLFKGAQGKRGADGAPGRKGGRVRVFHLSLLVIICPFFFCDTHGAGLLLAVCLK